ncbi:MAG TPA: potassium/proton antiporter [Caldilineaceae bacterium]|nr:potassium/proton antiporter [Caldilineaceae bacterium]
MFFDYVLLGTAILLLVSIVSSKASGRLGVPSLLIFLIVGMLAGSEGIGGIEFTNAALAQWIGVVALIFILFSGGLDTIWTHVRPVFAQGLVLATAGVLLTSLLVGAFVTYLLDLTWLEGLLLGAIVSSTDAAAVFAILRSRGVGLRGNLKSLLELESGSNDPMAIFLTTAMISLITGASDSFLDLVLMFFRQMVLGAAAGYLLGRAIVYIINHLHLEYEGLYPVLSIGLVLLVYSATALLGGNGFLAVYLAGLVMGNHIVIHRRSLMRFHDGLAWLMQIAMFLTLGLLVFPSQVLMVTGSGLLISLFLMFVARPVSVWLALLPFRMPWREVTLVGWVGLRGAVPIILATYPLLAGIEQANLLFNVVFFIVLTSVVLQGSTIPVVARWLRVDAPLQTRPRPPLEFEATDGIRGELVEVELPEQSPVAGKRLFELGLPRGALLVLVGRGESFLVPSGGTVLEPRDTLFVLAEPETLAEVRQVIQPDAERNAHGGRNRA